MAAGGQSLSRTLKAGLDVYYEFSCSSCTRRNGTNSEANHYCTKCNEFFCKICLDFHGGFQQTKDHKIIGRDKVDFWRKQKKNIIRSPKRFQEQCTIHPGQHVTMFCANHNTLLCHVCVSLEHRNCEDMNYIPIVADGIKQSPYYTAVIRDFERVQSNISNVKKSRHETKFTLDKSRKDFVDIIRDLRKQVNTIFDNLETKATTDTDNVHKEGITKADNDLEECDTLLADLDLLHKQLDRTSSDNEYQIFVNIKKFEERILECDQEVQSLAEAEDSVLFQFSIEPKITKFLTGLQSLGELASTQSKPPIIDTDKHVLKYNSNPRLCKAQTSHVYNVKIESDKKNCAIVGSCLIPDGSIILIDNNNNKLKRLNNSYHVTDYCNLPNAPDSVCCVGQQEVAVAMFPDIIGFVSIHKSEMSITRSFITGKLCHGIAYNNKKLYVSAYVDHAVFIYNMSGTCLSTIHKDRKGHEIFESPKYLAVRQDGSRIFVADFHKGLLILDDSGRHLSTYKPDDELSGAWGVCLYDKGSVLVGCSRSQNVVQLSDDGTRRLGIVAQLGDGDDLASICLDKGRESLIVTLDEKNYINVHRLK